MHYGNVLYVSSRLSNALWQCTVCFFYAVKRIMALCFLMLSSALWQCMFLLCCQMHNGNVCFVYAVKCMLAMYISSMLKNALW